MEDKITIIILIRNNKAYTKQCLLSVFEGCADINYEVIIVDNASEDDSLKMLQGLSPVFKNHGINVTYTRNKQNESFSFCNNQASRLAKGNKLLLLNNDTMVTKGCLKNMAYRLDTEQNVAIVGAKLIFPGEGSIQHAGVAFNNNGYPDHLYFRRDADDDDVNITKNYPAVTGACLMVKDHVYNEAGGLDERYIFGYEDIDLCNKVRELGWEVIYEPSAVAYHYGSQTPGRFDYENANVNNYASQWIFNGKYILDLEKYGSNLFNPS